MMSSPRKSSRREPKDLITGLPWQLIQRILVRMPLKDAVRTSILSRSWRYKWHSLPELVFDDTLQSQGTNDEFVDLITKVLMDHSGPVRKFVLIPSEFLPQHNAHLSRWMLFLLSKGIKELTLDDSSSSNMQLPSRLFACHELTSLRLCCLEFKAPPDFSGFAHLTCIDFEGITIAKETFRTLVSTASDLETLKMVNCIGIEDASIVAEYLKYFELWIEVKSVFCHMPNLVKSCLMLWETEDCNIDAWENSNVDMISFCWPKIEHLTLGFSAFKVLSARYAPRAFELNFRNLKNIELKFTAFQTIAQFKCAICLIQSSPNLQELVIKDSIISVAGDPIAEFLESPEVSSIKLPKLRTVRMEVITGIPAEMWLVKYLLLASPVLETMVIKYDRRLDFFEQRTLLLTLMRFSRTSRRAKIFCDRVE